MYRVVRAAALSAFVCGLSLVSAQDATRPVTDRDLRVGLTDSSRWLTFSGDYTGQRHSPLKQMTPQNVARLALQWMFQTDVPGFPGRGLEATPLVVDGVLYLTGNNNQAWALDGRTGRPLWNYRRKLPENFSASVCCGPVNRGFAILGDRLYMGTLDAHLLALDRKTGRVIWDVVVGDLKKANAITAAPLVVKNKVIIGVAGGDFSSRGYIDAYDAQTGERSWRFNTIPGPGEPGSESWPNAEVASRGGGAAWVTGSYDPALNLVYYGTGNPNPPTTATIAPATTSTPAHLSRSTPTRVRSSGTTSSRRTTCTTGTRRTCPCRPTFRSTVGCGRSSWSPTATASSTRSTARPGSCWSRNRSSTDRTGPRKSGLTAGRSSSTTSARRTSACRTTTAARTFSRRHSIRPRLFFVTAHETCAIWEAIKPTPPIALGVRVPSGGRRLVEGRDQLAALRAIDPTTGERRWEHRYRSYPSTVSLDLTGGLMSTAAGLVFTGDNDGYFYAFEATTGKELWRFQTGAPVWGSAPVTYMLDGRQWVLTAAGLSYVAFALN